MAETERADSPSGSNGALSPPPYPSTSSRTRSFSQLSNNTQPSPLARRSRPPLALSPLNAASPTSSYRSPLATTTTTTSVAPSTRGNTSPRYATFSVAPSIAGTAMTGTTVPGGVSRFKRAQMRKKHAPPPVRTADPNQLDLGTLEDPDEVFRLFGVRDVRGLEKRASDAAAAKVAELRTMVGERYRDLLSAADSIVRMRAASDKLVDRLDRVDSVVGGILVGETPSKKGVSALKRPRSPEQARTLASPTTLSLTIQLLLSLPSIVHSLLDAQDFLGAARLEAVGRAVYDELATFSLGGEDDEGGVTEAFPIIEKHHEGVKALRPLIVRRASEALNDWDVPPITTASTLASILMLQEGSLAIAFEQLLEARSTSLSTILDHVSHASTSSSHGKASHDVNTVFDNLRHVLGLLLKTVETASAVFGTDQEGNDGLLAQLLREVEKPTSQPPHDLPERLRPALSNLPNSTLLRKHLPSSILDFTPSLSHTSTSSLSTAQARSRIDDWLQTATEKVVSGIKNWISELRGGARTLAQVRDVVRSSLSTAGERGSTLQRDLEGAIEGRLAQVYQAHLRTVVDRVSPCLESLVKEQGRSRIETDAAAFLFETPLVFPLVSTSGNSKVMPGSKADPFEAFLEKVRKKVEGRSPLLDRGLGEMEAHARALRVDLDDWLGGLENGHAQGDSKHRLRGLYVHSAKETFDGVSDAMSSVLDKHQDNVEASLFLGHFAFALARSETFAHDLLLGTASARQSDEQAIVEEWQARLKTFQDRSLVRWREETVRHAAEQLSSRRDSVPSPTALPSQCSPVLLAFLRVLVEATRRLGPQRVQSDPAIVERLLVDAVPPLLSFLVPSVSSEEEVDEDARKGVAREPLFDLLFLGHIWRNTRTKEWSALEHSLRQQAGLEESSKIEQGARQYLQRTQTLFAPLLSPAPSEETSKNSSRLLPFGAPPSGLDLKGPATIVPGARLGLLPTR